MSPGKRKHIDPLERAIEAVLSPGRFISYSAAWSSADDVQDVADDVGKMIKKEPDRACKGIQCRFHPPWIAVRTPAAATAARAGAACAIEPSFYFH